MKKAIQCLEAIVYERDDGTMECPWLAPFYGDLTPEEYEKLGTALGVRRGCEYCYKKLLWDQKVKDERWDFKLAVAHGEHPDWPGEWATVCKGTDKDGQFIGYEIQLDLFPSLLSAEKAGWAINFSYFPNFKGLLETERGKNMITYIDVNELYPHPNNPRKDLGDLTELAGSIKERGVLQNLTVIEKKGGYCTDCNLHNRGVGKCTEDHDKTERPPCQYWDGKITYTVVIGHRRFAAAKLAGLSEVPCVIADMDERTQIATMLLENIQRNDLTVLEQAEGFQMMLDLGDTVAGISKATGFSETTVRHRVRLMELDKPKFAAAVQRGGTIQDYIALEQVKDTKRRNKVLEEIGTRNFQGALERELEEEAIPLRKKELIEFLTGWATPVKEQPKGASYEKGFHSFKCDDFKKPKDAGSAEYFYTVDRFSVSLYKTCAVPEKKEKTEAEKSYDKREAELKKLSKRAFDLRYAFVKEFGGSKKHAAEIYTLVFRRLTQYSHADLNNILKLLDIEKPEGENYNSEVQEAKHALISERYHEQPEKTMLIVAYACFDDKPSSDYFNARSWEHRIVHEKNNRLDVLYDALIALGYEMSDEERELRDGNHELFVCPETN
jgi:ParB family chromosome partitioning protein